MYGEELSPDSVDTYELAKDDKNPLALPAESDSVAYKAFWKNAEKLFVANCAHCHGAKGDGNGPMMVNETYVGVPNYADVAATEGQMFYSIYYGKGAMGSHRSIVNKKEIWTMVHYIQRLIDKDYGTAKAAEAADEDPEGEDVDGAEDGNEDEE
jgi:mono/diheme cytochrome c family protein